MVNLVRLTLDMMGSLERYCEAMDKEIASNDYNKLCRDSRYLLETFGEKDVDEYELRGNSTEIRKGIHALKAMANQLEEDVIDEDVVRSSYKKFKENSKSFMKELLECYINNESE